MKKPVWIVALLGAIAAACSGTASPPASAPPVSLQTEEQKTIYAMGGLIGQQLAPLKFSAADLELLKRGLVDAATSQTLAVDLHTYGPKIQALAESRTQAGTQARKAQSEPFRTAAAKEPGASQTASGLVFRSLKPGSGESPKATDKVKVHYVGTFVDGTVFDSSRQRGQPTEFKLNEVIACWTEGVQKMKVGETAKLVCPSDIAYGDRGRPGVPGGATLVFEVELLEIVKN